MFYYNLTDALNADLNFSFNQTNLETSFEKDKSLSLNNNENNVSYSQKVEIAKSERQNFIDKYIADIYLYSMYYYK